MGDEDLMEIIGNSKNVLRLQKHFKKMFAGVAQVILSEDGTQVLGVSSKEGESVSVTSCVDLCICSRVLQVLNTHWVSKCCAPGCCGAGVLIEGFCS